MATIGKLNVILAANTDALAGGLDKASSLVNGFSGAAGAGISGIGKAAPAVGEAFASMGTTALGAVAGAAGAVAGVVTGILSKIGDMALGAAQAIFAVVSEAVGLAAQAEQAHVAFSVLLKSEEKATTLLKDMSDFAAATPFEFPEIRSSAQQLLAFGVAGEQIIPTLKSLGDLASGSGSKIEEIAVIYGKVMSAGRATNHELMQMAIHGIPIYDALAKSLNTNVEGVRHLAEAGQVGVGDFQKAVLGLTDNNGLFSGMMEKQSATVLGLWSTLKDTISLNLTEIGKEIIEGFDLRGAIAMLTDGIGKVFGFLVSVIQFLRGELTPVFQAVFVPLWEGIQNFVSWASPIFKAYFGALKAEVIMLKEIFLTAVEFISGLWSQLFGGTDLTSGLNDLRERIVEGLISIEFHFLHWREVVALVLANVQLALIEFALNFLRTVPQPLVDGMANLRQAFAGDWGAIAKVVLTVLGGIAFGVYKAMEKLGGFLRESAKSIWKVFSELGKNIAELVKKIPDLIAGKVKFADLFGGVAQQLEEDPNQVKDNLIANLENQQKELEKKIGELQGGLNKDFADFLQKRLADINKEMDAQKKKGIDPLKIVDQNAKDAAKIAGPAAIQAGSTEALKLEAKFRNQTQIDQQKEAIKLQEKIKAIGEKQLAELKNVANALDRVGIGVLQF